MLTQLNVMGDDPTDELRVPCTGAFSDHGRARANGLCFRHKILMPYHKSS